MNQALEFLLKKEWSMGCAGPNNDQGQCPECCGVAPCWLGHPLHLTAATVGHKKNCPLAAAIKAAGGKPVMLGEFKSKLEFENCITDAGFFTTRPKTKNGCPRYRKFCKKLKLDFDKIKNQVVHEWLARTKFKPESVVKKV